MCALLPWLRRCLHSRAKGWGAYLFSPTAGPRPRTRASAGIDPTRRCPPPPRPRYSPRHAPVRFVVSLAPVQGYPARSRHHPPPSLARRGAAPFQSTPLPRSDWRPSLAAARRRPRSPAPPTPIRSTDLYLARFPRRFHHHTLPGRNFYVQRGLRGNPRLATSPYPIFPVHGGGEAPASGEITWPGADLTSFPPRLLMDLSPWTGTFRGDSWLGGK